MGDEVAQATLSPLEVAKMLGIGERQAREFIKSGQLYSFRVGRRILVPRRAVEALLSGQRLHESDSSKR